MQVVRILLLSLIAVVFAVSGTARAMPMPAGEPPCHEAPAAPEKQKPAQVAVNCCAGCMPAPSEVAVVLAVISAQPTAYAVVDTAGEGRLTAPEPDPPRLQA